MKYSQYEEHLKYKDHLKYQHTLNYGDNLKYEYNLYIKKKPSNMKTTSKTTKSFLKKRGPYISRQPQI